jgi:hypothetical protein
MPEGKYGDVGRFVTLRSGRVIFIPAGKRSKWADVRDRIEAGRVAAGAKAKDVIADATAGYGHTWDGRLYRSETGEGGRTGDYYAVDPENAEMYAELAGGAPVESFAFPDVEKPFIVNIDEGGLTEVERFAGEKFEDVGDIAMLIEDALPSIRGAGYDSVVIIGETGPDIWGVPVEFVDLTGKVGNGI